MSESTQSAGAEISPYTERIYLLPQDAYEHDVLAENQLPPLLKGIPCFRLEQLGKVGPLIQRHGEIKKVSGVESVGNGQHGFVFHINNAGKEFALKITGSTGLPMEKVRELIKNFGITFDPTKEAREVYDPKNDSWYKVSTGEFLTNCISLDTYSTFTPETIYEEVAAGRIAHYLEPEYTLQPEAIWTLDGIPIGFSMDYFPGESDHIHDAATKAFPYSKEYSRALEIMEANYKRTPINLTPEEQVAQQKRQRYRRSVEHLKKSVVNLDIADPAENAIIGEENGATSIKIVDMFLKDRGALYMTFEHAVKITTESK